jgi:hypothetical protein
LTSPVSHAGLTYGHYIGTDEGAVLLSADETERLRTALAATPHGLADQRRSLISSTIDAAAVAAELRDEAWERGNVAHAFDADPTGRAAGFGGSRGSIIARWSDIERGRRPDMRISTLRAIALALGVSISDLLAD